MGEHKYPLPKPHCPVECKPSHPVYARYQDDGNTDDGCQIEISVFMLRQHIEEDQRHRDENIIINWTYYYLNMICPAISGIGHQIHDRDDYQ